MVSNIVTYAFYGLLAYFALKGAGIQFNADNFRSSIGSFGEGLSSGFYKESPTATETPSFVYRR